MAADCMMQQSLFFIFVLLHWGQFFTNGMPYDGSEIESSGDSGDCGCSLTRAATVATSSALDNMETVENIVDNVGDSLDSDVVDDGECIVGTNNVEMMIEKMNNKMVTIEGGKFFMGTDNALILTDGESPRRPVSVGTFALDQYEVSNEDYGIFVNSTGYRTDSEVYGWSFVFDAAIPKHLKRGITQAVLGAEWWLPVNGSYWREPEGPGTDVFKTNRSNLPAVHISWTDAHKFCEWRGARLPTEAEWEYAAQGKVNDKATMFPWGKRLTPNGVHKTNIFQGKFPKENTGEDGFPYLAPVDAFGPQNDYGLYNMIGNAWEWVEDWWTIDHPTSHTVNPRGPRWGKEKVKKGGSFLCHRSFCYRYRTAARYATTPDSATLNSGMRCARDVTAPAPGAASGPSAAGTSTSAPPTEDDDE